MEKGKRTLWVAKELYEKLEKASKDAGLSLEEFVGGVIESRLKELKKGD